MTYVCGIDCGTQSTKIIIYDSQAKKIIANSSAAHQLFSNIDGTMEQHPSWWINAIKDCFSQIDPKIKSQIKAIGVSGQQHGFVALGKNDEVLCNAKLWCDTTTVKECEQIITAFGGKEKLLQEVGNSIIPAYTLPKILWLKNHRTEFYKQLTTILLPHDYINFYLTGNKVMEFGDASGTGILDIKTKTWSQKILNCVDSQKNLLACLPPLIKADQMAGFVTESVAKDLGLAPKVIVSSGGGDNMMGAIGTGTVDAGALTMSLGTSGTLFGYSDKPVIDSLGVASAFCSSTGGYLPLVCTQNCTVSTELIRSLFDMEVKDLEAYASRSEVGANGVIALPFFTGERTPALPKGKGSFMGITSQNMNKENMTRACMEAAVFSLKLGLASFVNAGFKPSFVNLIGGGSKSATWRQIVADTLNLPVKIPLQTEAAAFGAALQSLWCLDKNLNPSLSIETVIHDHLEYDQMKSHLPNSNAVKSYQDVYQQFCKYVQLLTPMYT